MHACPAFWSDQLPPPPVARNWPLWETERDETSNGPGNNWTGSRSKLIIAIGELGALAIAATVARSAAGVSAAAVSADAHRGQPRFGRTGRDSGGGQLRSGNCQFQFCRFWLPIAWFFVGWFFVGRGCRRNFGHRPPGIDADQADDHRAGETADNHH